MSSVGGYARKRGNMYLKKATLSFYRRFTVGQCGAIILTFVQICANIFRDGWYSCNHETVPDCSALPPQKEQCHCVTPPRNEYGTEFYQSVSDRKECDTMKIGFIGAGKVGFSLGKVFSEGGLQVIGYCSRHKESAEAAAKFTESKCYDDPGRLVADCDAVFLTVPDGVITEIFEKLKDYDLKGRQICHCSGSMTAQKAFPGIGQTGAEGYSIHPLFPVSDRYASYRELKDAFFCIEGSAAHLNDWKERLQSLGPRVQAIPSGQKVLYHAACAIASNLVCALVQESLDLLEDCGFTRTYALQAITPLLRSNMEHIISHGPAGALTGPMERNDVETVRKHLGAFPTAKDQALYREVSKKLLETAQEKHPDTDYTDMKKVLEKEAE